MKKIYSKPELNEIVLNSLPLLSPTSVNPTEAEGGTDGFAPGQREELEIFLFQLMGL